MEMQPRVRGLGSVWFTGGQFFSLLPVTLNSLPFLNEMETSKQNTTLIDEIVCILLLSSVLLFNSLGMINNLHCGGLACVQGVSLPSCTGWMDGWVDRQLWPSSLVMQSRRMDCLDVEN